MALVCAECTWENPPHYDYCEACCGALATDGGPAPAIVCRVCTFENALSDDFCAVCAECLDPAAAAATALAIALAAAEPDAAATEQGATALAIALASAELDAEAAAASAALLMPPSDAHTIYYKCPHCDRDGGVDRTQINCTIFICGVDAQSWRQVNQHDEAGAQRLLQAGRLAGCGRQHLWDGEKMVRCAGR